MRKLLFLFVLLVMTWSVQGQNEVQKQQCLMYAEECAKAFGLSTAQQNDIFDLRVDFVLVKNKLDDKVKSNKATNDDVKSDRYKTDMKFIKKVAKITGKPEAEFIEFHRKLSQKIEISKK